MELWLIYAIIATLIIWGNNFLLKVFSANNTPSHIVLICQAIVFMIAWFIHAQIKDIWMNIGYLIFICASVITIFHFLNYKIRIRVLKYLSSSEYFISARLINTTLLTLLWLSIFSENISWLQLFWLTLGSIAVLLLFEEDKKFQHSRNWKTAIFLLIISVLYSAIIQIVAKYIAINASESIPTVLFYEGFVLFIVSLLSLYQDKDSTSQIKNMEWKMYFAAIFSWFCYYFSTIANLAAFEYGWSLSIVSKIIAYSLFIPIILSAIFYREKITYKKWIAFLLTIISIYYLN